MQIQLSWIDPNTEERRQPCLRTPVAIGRKFSRMPQESNGQLVSRMVIQDDLIAEYHALIDWQNQELIIIDQNTTSGIKINGVQLTLGRLKDGDRIQIGACEIVVNFAMPVLAEEEPATTSPWECDRPYVAEVLPTGNTSPVPQGQDSVAQSNAGQQDAPCERMVGFLFKRRCGRTDRRGCPYCSQEYENNDPYYYDYAYYDGYGVYRSGYWGSDYYSERDRYCYNPETGNVDFTEADCISLEEERDSDFESNMGAS